MCFHYYYRHCRQHNLQHHQGNDRNHLCCSNHRNHRNHRNRYPEWADRLPYAKSSKEPSQESDSVEVDMDGWQVAPPNLGKDDGDSNNTDDFDHFLDHAANCVGGNDDNNSENTHMSSDTEF